MIETLQLTAVTNSAAETSNLASVQFFNTGKIAGIQYGIKPYSGAAADLSMGVQLSFNSQIQTANDVRGEVVCNIWTSLIYTTSGVSMSNLNGYFPCGVGIKPAQRLYIHVHEAFSNAGDSIWFTLYIDK